MSTIDSLRGENSISNQDYRCTCTTGRCAHGQHTTRRQLLPQHSPNGMQPTNRFSHLHRSQWTVHTIGHAHPATWSGTVVGRSIHDKPHPPRVSKRQCVVALQSKVERKLQRHEHGCCVCRALEWAVRTNVCSPDSSAGDVRGCRDVVNVVKHVCMYVCMWYLFNGNTLIFYIFMTLIF